MVDYKGSTQEKTFPNIWRVFTIPPEICMFRTDFYILPVVVTFVLRKEKLCSGVCTLTSSDLARRVEMQLHVNQSSTYPIFGNQVP
jgi:hypothetical protein